jgi:hypothetical protein
MVKKRRDPPGHFMADAAIGTKTPRMEVILGMTGVTIRRCSRKQKLGMAGLAG